MKSVKRGYLLAYLSSAALSPSPMLSVERWLKNTTSFLQASGRPGKFLDVEPTIQSNVPLKEVAPSVGRGFRNGRT